MPKGADAVVQIENTEQLPAAQSGRRRVRIKQVLRLFSMQKPMRAAASVYLLSTISRADQRQGGPAKQT